MKAPALLVACLAASSVASGAGNPVITHTEPNVLYSIKKEQQHLMHDHLHLLGANLIPPWNWADGVVANHVDVDVKVTDGSGSHIGGSGVLASAVQFSSTDLVIKLSAYTPNPPLKSLAFRVTVDTPDGPTQSNWFEVPVKPPPAVLPVIKKLQPASFVISPQTTSYEFSIAFDNVDTETTATVGGTDCNSKAKTNSPNSISEGTIFCEVPPALRKAGKLNVQVRNAAGSSPFAWLDLVGAPKISSIQPATLYVTMPQASPNSSTNQIPPPNAAQSFVTPQAAPSPHKNERKVVVYYSGSQPAKVAVNNGIDSTWSPLHPKDLEFAASGGSLAAWIYKGVVEPQNPFQDHTIKLRVSNEAGSDTGTIWVMKAPPKGSGGGPPAIQIPAKAGIQPPPGPGPIGDPQIRQLLQQNLTTRLGAAASGIQVTVINGFVTLTGQVRTPQEKASAGEAARGIGGVKGIATNLRVIGGARP